jgi:hypothetical protein
MRESKKAEGKRKKQSLGNKKVRSQIGRRTSVVAALLGARERETPNAQHPTSNVEVDDARQTAEQLGDLPPGPKFTLLFVRWSG